MANGYLQNIDLYICLNCSTRDLVKKKTSSFSYPAYDIKFMSHNVASRCHTTTINSSRKTKKQISYGSIFPRGPAKIRPRLGFWPLIKGHLELATVSFHRLPSVRIFGGFHEISNDPSTRNSLCSLYNIYIYVYVCIYGTIYSIIKKVIHIYI